MATTDSNLSASTTCIHDIAEEDEFNTWPVIASSAAHASNDIYQSFLSPLLPVLIEKFSLLKSQAGLLSVFSQIPSLLQPILGLMGDRLNLKYVAILAPAITGIMMSLIGVAPSYGIIAVLLMLAGASSAAFHSVSPVQAARFSGKQLGRGMAIWMVGGEVGFTLGPLLVVSVVSSFSLSSLPWVMILGFVASFLLFLFFRNVTMVQPSPVEDLPVKSVLKGMRHVMIPLFGLIIARAFMEASLVQYLPIFLTEEGANLWFAGASLSVMQTAGVVGTLLGGAISDRIGRRPILLISILGSSLFMFLFISTHNWTQVLVLLALGFNLLSVGPVLLAVVQENFPQNRSLANGIYLMVSFIVRSIVTFSIGLFADHYGLRLAFMGSGGLILLGVPLLFLLPKISKKNS